MCEVPSSIISSLCVIGVVFVLDFTSVFPSNFRLKNAAWALNCIDSRRQQCETSRNGYCVKIISLIPYKITSGSSLQQVTALEVPEWPASYGFEGPPRVYPMFGLYRPRAPLYLIKGCMAQCQQIRRDIDDSPADIICCQEKDFCNGTAPKNQKSIIFWTIFITSLFVAYFGVQ